METGQVKYIEAAVCENGEEFRLVHVTMSDWHRCCNSTYTSIKYCSFARLWGERSKLPSYPCSLVNENIADSLYLYQVLLFHSGSVVADVMSHH